MSNVLPYINGLTIALQRLFTFIGELIGIEIDLSDLGGTGTDASDIMSDILDGAEEATEKVEELKYQLMGFDEINKLSGDEEDTALGIGGIDTGLLDAAFDDALSKYQETWDKAFANMENGSERIADRIEKALEPVKKIIEDFAIGDFFSAGEDVSNLVVSITKFINKAIKSVDWYDVGKKIGDFINGINWSDVAWNFLELAKSIIRGINSAFDGLGDTILPGSGFNQLREFSFDALEGFYENFLKPIGEWTIGKGIPDLIDGLNKVLKSVNWKKLTDNLNEFWKAIQPLAVGFGEGVIDFFQALAQIGAFVIEAIGNAIGFVGKVLNLFKPEALEALGKALATLAAGFLAFKAGVAIANGILKISSAISTLLTTIAAHPFIAMGTAIATLATALYSLVSAKDEVNEEPLEITISDNVLEFADKIDKAVTSLKNFKEQSSTTFSDIEVGYENALITAQKYFELSQKDPSLFTEADIANLKKYKDTLEQYGIDMKGSIDEVTGAWKGTNEELLKLIENQRNASKLQAYTDILAEAQKQDITLRRDLQEAFNQFDDKELLADLWTRYNKGATKYDDKLLKDMAKQYNKTTNEVASAMEAFNNLKDVYFAVAENQEYMNDISEDYIQFQKDMGYVSSDVSNDMLKDTRDVLSGITTGIYSTENSLVAFADKTEKKEKEITDTATAEASRLKTGVNAELNSIKKEVNISVNTLEAEQSTTWGVANMNTTIGWLNKNQNLSMDTTQAEQSTAGGVTGMNTSLDGLNKNQTLTMNTTPATTAATTAKNNINSTFAQILKPLITLDTVGLANETLLAKRTIENGLKGINIGLEIKLQEKVKDTITTGFNLGLAIKQKVGEIQAYAIGGFPTRGLSLVGENGPELYGSMDGRPAVAANSSITAGIEEAAYRGMMRALSESGGGATNVTFEVQGDPNRMFRVIQKQANTYTRQTGKSPFLY